MPVLCEALEVGLVDLLHGADAADLTKLRLS
jgi:hypothetical protein